MMQLVTTVKRNYSDSLRIDQISRLTINFTDARFDNGYPQLAIASWPARRASYPIQALSSPAMEHQAAKSEYLLWGQKQTGTIHSPAYGGLNRSSGHIMKFSVFTKRHTTTLIYVPYLPKVPMYIVLHTCYAYLPRGSYVGTYCRYALYHGRCMSYIAMYGVPTYMSS